MVLNSPIGEQLRYIVYLFFQASNNVAEYEGLVTGLTLVLSLGVRELQGMGDSQFVIKQVNGECTCNKLQLVTYLLKIKQMELLFDVIEFKFIPQEQNTMADELSSMASTRQHEPDGVFDYWVPYPTARPANPDDDGTDDSIVTVVASTFEAPLTGEGGFSPA